MSSRKSQEARYCSRTRGTSCHRRVPEVKTPGKHRAFSTGPARAPWTGAPRTGTAAGALPAWRCRALRAISHSLGDAMEILVAYDVSTETAAGRRRLRQVANACLAYGQRVQKSVFECALTAQQLVSLEHRLAGIVDEEEDQPADLPANGATGSPHPRVRQTHGSRCPRAAHWVSADPEHHRRNHSDLRAPSRLHRLGMSISGASEGTLYRSLSGPPPRWFARNGCLISNQLGAKNLHAYRCSLSVKAGLRIETSRRTTRRVVPRPLQPVRQGRSED